MGIYHTSGTEKADEEAGEMRSEKPRLIKTVKGCQTKELKRVRWTSKILLKYCSFKAWKAILIYFKWIKFFYEEDYKCAAGIFREDTPLLRRVFRREFYSFKKNEVGITWKLGSNSRLPLTARC